MILLISLCYLGCVFVAFKVIKLNVNPVSVAVAAVVGVLLLGGIIIAWKFSAPMSQQMIVYRPVIPLVASQNTKEVITKIHVKVEQPVKEGDLLYEVETAPFEHAVEQQTAVVAEAKEKIRRLEAAVAVAASELDAAKAARQKTKTSFEIGTGVQKADPGAVAELNVEIAKFSDASAQAAIDSAVSAKTVADYDLLIGRESLKKAEAQLRTTRLELERAFTKAPADGHIINWQASEGTMTTTVITSAQGTFQDMTQTVVLAVYRQNLLKNVAPGDAVEIAFQSLPNHLATGKVEAVLEYTGEGQIMTQGSVPVATTIGSKGFLGVRILLDDDAFARELALGGGGTTAIYTGFGKPFHVITKIALRMKSWLYNLPV